MTRLLQFVDSISSSPTVRLDLTASPWCLLGDGFDFSPPKLRQATAETMMRSGATVTAAAYANRVLQFRLALQADDADLAASAVQDLARELDRSDTMELGGTSNYLKWQPDTSAPVFFRTFRSDMGSIRERPRDSGSRYFDLAVLAEPFAYGLLVTQDLVTVTNNPATTGNPMYFDLDDVQGDVDTPLILEVDGANLYNASEQPVTVIATRRRGTPSNAPFALQAEAMSMGTDTTTQANSASFSGTGNNYIRCTFSGVATMVSRAYVLVHPASPSVDVRGQYRVFARVRPNSAAAGDIDLQLGWGAAAQVFTNAEVALGNVSGSPINLVDLGLVAFPPGGDAVYSGGTELSVSGQYFDISARRNSGASTLDIDYLLFVPADDQMALVMWNQALGDTTPDEFVMHGPTETIYGQSSSGIVPGGLTHHVGLRGGFLWGRPGVTNRIYFLRHVAKVTSGDSVTATTEIRVSYFPQYLYVRPVST